jgi:hypothetical protein
MLVRGLLPRLVVNVHIPQSAHALHSSPDGVEMKFRTPVIAAAERAYQT